MISSGKRAYLNYWRLSSSSFRNSCRILECFLVRSRSWSYDNGAGN
nr:MAG TPA: hypothetical protein [Caudoviricetes sp.]